MHTGHTDFNNKPYISTTCLDERDHVIWQLLWPIMYKLIVKSEQTMLIVYNLHEII